MASEDPGLERWTDADDRLFDSMGDAAIAAKLGRSVHAVKQRRWRLGKTESRAWTDEDDAWLAKSSDDRWVAKKLGRSPIAVQRRRARLQQKRPSGIGRKLAAAVVKFRGGRTPAECAAAAEIGLQTWKDVESGRADPRLSTLAAIARGLDVPLRKLIDAAVG